MASRSTGIYLYNSAFEVLNWELSEMKSEILFAHDRQTIELRVQRSCSGVFLSIFPIGSVECRCPASPGQDGVEFLLLKVQELFETKGLCLIKVLRNLSDSCPIE